MRNLLFKWKKSYISRLKIEYEKLHKGKYLFITNNFSELLKKKSVSSLKISKYFNILDDKQQVNCQILWNTVSS